MRKTPLLLAVLAALIGAAAVFGFRHLTEHRAAAALARFERTLPATAKLTHGDVNVRFLAGAGAVDDVVVSQAGVRLSAGHILMEGGEVRAEDVRLITRGGLKLTAETARGRFAATMRETVRQSGQERAAPETAGAWPGLQDGRLTGVRLETPYNLLTSPNIYLESVYSGRGRPEAGDLETGDLETGWLGRLEAGALAWRVRTGGAGEAASRVWRARGVQVRDARFADLRRLAAMAHAEPLGMFRALSELRLGDLRASSLRLHPSGLGPGARGTALLRATDLRLARPRNAQAVAWRFVVGDFAARVPAPDGIRQVLQAPAGTRLRGSLDVTQRVQPEAGVLRLSHMDLRLQGVGRLSGGLTLRGVPPPRTRGGPGLYLNHSALAALDLRLLDKSLRDRTLAVLAARRGASPHGLRNAAHTALARRAKTAGAGAARESLKALAGFLADGGALRVQAAPRDPIPLARLLYEVSDRPLRLAARDDVTFTRE